MSAWGAVASGASSLSDVGPISDIGTSIENQVGGISNMVLSQQELHNANVANTGGNDLMAAQNALGAASTNGQAAGSYLTAEAKAAGLSPLALAGVNPSLGPVGSVSDPATTGLQAAQAGTVGAGGSQNIARAIAAGSKHAARMQYISDQVASAGVENTKADSALKRAQALSLMSVSHGQVGTGPAIDSGIHRGTSLPVIHPRLSKSRGFNPYGRLHIPGSMARILSHLNGGD